MFAQVLHQVIPISHLGGVRQSPPDGNCVRTRAIPADHFNLLVPLEPRQDGFSRAICQQIKRFACLKVNQDRSVAVPAPDGLGKGNGVTAIPSPKNRAGMFPCTRLKPFMTPV